MFKIVRWDAVITGNSDVPKPLVYFSPNLTLLEFARRNNYQFPVHISGTQSPNYDGTYWAIMDKSSVVPNCRPNFFEATNLYVLTLLSTWNGYPQKEGSFSLDKNIETPKMRAEPPSTNNKKKNTKLALILMLSGIAVLVLVLLYSAFKK